MRNSAFLAIVICLLAATNPAYASTIPQDENILVDLKQVDQPTGTWCKYHVTNISREPMMSFEIGRGSDGKEELPFPPSNLSYQHNIPTPTFPKSEASPIWRQHWSGPTSTYLYATGWDIISPENAPKQWQSADFAIEFPDNHSIHCDDFHRNTRFYAIYPPITYDPKTLSVTLTNLKQTQYETTGLFVTGDVTIQNISSADVRVNLGVKLSNGRLLPNRFFLHYHTPDGKQYEGDAYNFGDYPHTQLPEIISLAPQQSYTLHDVTWSISVRIPSGAYQFYAEFKGTTDPSSPAEWIGFLDDTGPRPMGVQLPPTTNTSNVVSVSISN